MEIRVLGPVELVDGGHPLSLPTMPRRLLAMLVLRAGEACSADRLIEALWAEAPPASAAKLLQVYVSQLRKALPEPGCIHTGRSGYVLDLADGVLDAARFERLLKEANEMKREANPALAASLLRRALSLWRGAAYGEFAYEEFAHAEAERLEELRMVCLEERLEAELALGRADELLAELRGLSTAHPLRERLQAQAMLALYRCGRQTEALALYAEIHVRLRDELGLDPGTELRELQRLILQQDASLSIALSPREALVRLPAEPNTLLGRGRELAELDDLLRRDDVRLLVLTGAGGSGKTRLAVEVARKAVGRFANGVVFVPLATLREPGLVAAAIADAAGVERAVSQDVARTLSVAFRSQEMLLVVDNAEHVRSAAPLFVELLAQAPRLTLLVTSRVVLHVSGERVYPVQPLDIRAAAELFCQRAAAADPTAAFDEAQRDAIATICARLDGLPLAVELAAAHARTLTPTELLARLERRLPLLAGGPRDLPARQQTLRATLDWSYGLLNASERQLFRRMSVFAADSTLEAIETVCETTPEVVASLVDHSLVHRAATAAVSRFTMLETVREFAAERLHESADGDRVRRRHAEFLLNAAESWSDAQRSQETRPGRPRLLPPAPDDTRAALKWALAAHDALAPRLAIAAGRHWHAQGRLAEGRSFIEAALVLGQGDEVVRAELLGLLAAVSYDGGDAVAAEQALAQALSLAREAGDERLEGWLRALRAEVQVAFSGPLRDSLAECEAAALLLERTGDRAHLADALVVLGKLRFWAGTRPGDADALERAVALARATQNRAAELLALESLALLYVDLRTPSDHAIAEQGRLLEAARGAPRAEAGILMSLAWLYQYAGRLDDARLTLARSREMFKSFGATVEWAAGARTAAAIELLAGDPIAAERELREARYRVEGADQAILASVTGWLAEALYAQGRYEDARRAALDARLLTPTDDREVHVRSRAVEAKVRAHRGEDKAAERLLHDAVKHLAARPPPRGPSADFWTTTLLEPETLSPILVGTLLLARGEVLQLLGKPEQAAQTCRAAHNLYRNKRAWPLAERAQRQLEHVR